MHIQWKNGIADLPDSRAKSTDNETRKDTRRKDKATSQKSDLCRAISPIYYLGKVCGLVPVQFVEYTTGRYEAHLSIIDLAYSLCVLVLLLGMQNWGLYRDLRDGWEHSIRLKSRTALVATFSDILGVMSLTVVCIVGSPFRWKYLQVIINKLIEVDEKVGVPSARRTRGYTIGLTVCSVAYLWFNSILDLYTWNRKVKFTKTLPDKGPVNYMPLYFMYTVIIFTEIQYTVSTYNVGQRFVRLNNSLSNLITSTKAMEYFADDTLNQRTNTAYRQFEQKSFRIFPKLNEGKSYVNSVSELIVVHSSLCDTVSLVNNAFGLLILAVTVTCLLHLVITPYFLIIQAGEHHEWIFLVVQSMWCVFHVTRMLIIIQPSYFTIAEGKRTAVLVSQLLSSSYEPDARRELEIFSLQLLHRPIEFAACGLFAIDRTLITSIAGVVTTYLVILIQFQNADDTKGDVDIIRNATQLLKNAPSLHNLTALKI